MNPKNEHDSHETSVSQQNITTHCNTSCETYFMPINPTNSKIIHLMQQFIKCNNSIPFMLQLKVVEFWGSPPLILFFNTSTGWFGRFVLSIECCRTRKLDYNDLNWPRCSAQVTESLALIDGGFCQKQTLYILDYVKIVSL